MPTFLLVYNNQRNTEQVYQYRCKTSQTPTVHWHLINLGGVVLLNVSENSDVVRLDKVDCHTLASEAS